MARKGKPPIDNAMISVLTANEDLTIRELTRRASYLERPIALNTIAQKMTGYAKFGLLKRVQGELSNNRVIYRVTEAELIVMREKAKEGLSLSFLRGQSIKKVEPVCTNPNRQDWRGAKIKGKAGEKIYMMGCWGE